MSRPVRQVRPHHASNRAPTRSCVACRTERDKRDLVRIVRAPGGEVLLDPTGKASGRGAYLCADPACWSKALSMRAVQRALEVPTSDGLTAILVAGPPAETMVHEATHGA